MGGKPVVRDGEVWREAPEGTPSDGVVIEQNGMAALGYFLAVLFARDDRATECLGEP